MKCSCDYCFSLVLLGAVYTPKIDWAKDSPLFQHRDVFPTVFPFSSHDTVQWSSSFSPGNRGNHVWVLWALRQERIHRWCCSIVGAADVTRNKQDRSHDSIASCEIMLLEDYVCTPEILVLFISCIEFAYIHLQIIFFFSPWHGLTFAPQAENFAQSPFLYRGQETNIPP